MINPASREFSDSGGDRLVPSLPNAMHANARLASTTDAGATRWTCTMRAVVELAILAVPVIATLLLLRRRQQRRRQPVCNESEADRRALRLLVDLRTWCAAKNGVRGNISALIMRNGTVLSWGYVRSMLKDASGGKKARAKVDLHAEADAITTAARNGVQCEGATLYCSSICCVACFRLVVAAGIVRVVHPPPPRPDFYSSDRCHVAALAKLHGVTVEDCAVLPPFRHLKGEELPLPVLARAWGAPKTQEKRS